MFVSREEAAAAAEGIAREKQAAGAVVKFTAQHGSKRAHKPDPQALAAHVGQQARRIRDHYPDPPELWIVGASHDNGYFDLFRTDGATMQEVPVMDLRKWRGIKVGSTVSVRYRQNDPQKAYIKSTARTFTDPEIDPFQFQAVSVRAGTWTQVGGYWWESWLSLFNMYPLSLVLAPIEVTETKDEYTTEPLPLPSTKFGGSDVHNFAYFQLNGMPTGSTELAFTQVIVDGVDVSAYFLEEPHSGGVSYNSPGNPSFLTGFKDFSGTDGGPTVLPSEVTTIEITYTFVSAGAVPLTTGTAGTGPDKAMSPRGVSMMPATRAPSAQVVGVLESDYQAVGAEIRYIDVQQNFYSIVVGTSYVYTLDHEPHPDTDSVTVNFESYSPFLTTLWWVDTTNFVFLATSTGEGGWANGDIHVTYGIVPTDPSDPEDFIEYFEGDGIANVFTLADVPWPNPDAFLNFVYDDNTEENDILATLNTDTGEVTMSYVPAGPSVALITISYNATAVPAGPDEVTDIFPAPGAGETQTVFELSQVPVEGTITTLIPNDDPYVGPGWNFWGDTGFPYLPEVVPLYDADTNSVRFAIKARYYFGINRADYTYTQEFGDLFNLTGMKVRELNVTLLSGYQNLPIPFPAPFDATPLSKFLPYIGSGNVSSAEGDRWQDGWWFQRWGFLHYDPTADCYTVVTPVGLFWRSRKPGSVLGAHYTYIPWPDEAVSKDKTFAGWDWDAYPNFWSAGSHIPVIAGLKRRTAPWLGVSAMTKYAMQGSWAPVGSNNVARIPWVEGTPPVGNPSDDDAFLRFFGRKDKVWSHVASLSVRELADVSVRTDPDLYVCGSGLVHAEGAPNGWPSGRGNSGNERNTWCTGLRNAEAWVVPAGWCKSTWLANQSALDNRNDWTDFKLGLDEAGLTISTIDPASGKVVDQMTFRCPKGDASVVDGYDPADYAKQVDHNMTLVENQFTWPGTVVPPAGLDMYFGVSTEYVASGRWGYWPRNGVNQYVFFYYCMTAKDGPPKKPRLQYPGIPALADGEPRYSADIANSRAYGYIGTEDRHQNLGIPADEHNNLYLCTSEPFFTRQIDTMIQTNTQQVFGEFEYTANHAVSTLASGHWLQYNCVGWEGSPIISGIRDIYTNSSQAYWDSVGAVSPNYLTFNGAYYESFPQSGHTTVFQYTFEKQVFFPAPTSVGPDDISYQCGWADPPANTIPVYCYTHLLYYQGPVRAPWYTTIPHLEWATFREYWPIDTNVPPSWSFYAIPGYIDFGPYAGGVIFDVTGDNRRQYSCSAKTMLRKIAVDSKTRKMTLLWEKDISTENYAGPRYTVSGQGFDADPSVVKAHQKVYFTRPVGRLILLLRIRLVPVVDPMFPTQPPPYHQFLVLEAYENGDTLPGDPVWTLWLPHPDIGDGETTTTDPPTDYVSAQIPTGLWLTVGVDHEDSREWALVTGLLGGLPWRLRARYGAELGDTPEVFFDHGVVDDKTPTPYNSQGMAQAVDQYVWVDDTAGISVRPGG